MSFDPNSALICHVNRPISQDVGTQRRGSSTLSDAPQPSTSTLAAGSTPEIRTDVANDGGGAPKTIEICVNGVKQTILVPDVQDTSDDFFNFFPGTSSITTSENALPQNQSGSSSSFINSGQVLGAGSERTRVPSGVISGVQLKSSKMPVVVDLCSSDPDTPLPPPPPPPSITAPARPRSPVDVKFRAQITQNWAQQQRTPLGNNYGVQQFGTASYVDQSQLYQDVLQNNAFQTERTNPHHGVAGGSAPPEYWSRSANGFAMNSVGYPPNPGFLNPRGFPRSSAPYSGNAIYRNSLGGSEIGGPMYDQTRFREPNFDKLANLSNNALIGAAAQLGLSRSTLDIMSGTSTANGGCNTGERTQTVQWGVKTPGTIPRRSAPIPPGELRPSSQYTHLVSALGDMITSSNGYFYSCNSLLPSGNNNPLSTQAGFSSLHCGMSGVNGLNVALSPAHNPNLTDSSNLRQMITSNLPPPPPQQGNQNMWNFSESPIQLLNSVVGVSSVNQALPQQLVSNNGQTVTTLANNHFSGLHGSSAGVNVSMGVGYGNHMAGNVIPPWSSNNVQTQNGHPTSNFNPNVGLPRGSNNAPLTTRYLSLMQQRQAPGYVASRPPTQSNDGVVGSMYRPALSDSFLVGGFQSRLGKMSSMPASNQNSGGPQMITNPLGLYSGMADNNQPSEIRTNAETIAPNQFSGIVGGHVPFQQSGPMMQGQLTSILINCNQSHGSTAPLEPPANFGGYLSPRMLLNYQQPIVNSNNVTPFRPPSSLNSSSVTSARTNNDASVVEWLNQSMPPSSEHPPSLSHGGGRACCAGGSACQHSDEFAITFTDLCGSIVDSILNKSPRSQTGVKSPAHNAHSPRNRNLSESNQSSVSQANVANNDTPLSAKSKKAPTKGKETPHLTHLLNVDTDTPAGLQFKDVSASFGLTPTKKPTSRKTVHCKIVKLPASVVTGSKGRRLSVPPPEESTNGDKLTAKERPSLYASDIASLRKQTIAALDRTSGANATERDFQTSFGEQRTSKHSMSNPDGGLFAKHSKDGGLLKKTARKKSSTAVKSKSKSKLATANGTNGNEASKPLSAIVVDTKDSSENRPSNDAPLVPQQTFVIRKTNYSFYNLTKTPAKLDTKAPAAAASTSSKMTVDSDVVAINNNLVNVDRWMLSNDASAAAKTKHLSTNRLGDLIDPNELTNETCDDALMNSNDCGSSNVDSLMELFPELSDMDSTTGVGDQLDRDSCLRSLVESTTDPTEHCATFTKHSSGSVRNRSKSPSHDDVSIIRAKYKSVGKSPENSLRGRGRYKSVGKSPRFVQRAPVVKRKRKRQKKINSLSGGSADDSNDSWYIPEEDIDTPPSPVSSRRRRRLSSSSASWASDDSVTIGKRRRKKRRRLSDDDFDDGLDDPPQCDWPRRDERNNRRSVRRKRRIPKDWWVQQQQAVHDISDCSVLLERLYLRRRRAVNARDIARYLCCAPKQRGAPLSSHHQAGIDSDDESHASSRRVVKKASRIVYFSDTDEDDATTQDCRSVNSSANTSTRSVNSVVTTTTKSVASSAVTVSTIFVTSSIVTVPAQSASSLVNMSLNNGLSNELCSSTMSDGVPLLSHTQSSVTSI